MICTIFVLLPLGKCLAKITEEVGRRKKEMKLWVETSLSLL